LSSYPIALIGLADALCVVVGGGEVAVRKVAALREAGARPVVISPVVDETLQRRAERGEIQLVPRPYRPGDLAGARLVIAATDDSATNCAVWREAQAVGCLVNVVDDPAHCNFYVPATVRRGALTISISTAGNSPALARRIRQSLEHQFDDGYQPYLALLGELRPLVQKRIVDPARRKALWEALLAEDLLELCRMGKDQIAQQRAMAVVDTFASRTS
jgi:precorrin-2 dehydrogenase/sirohydrochlorin ferrochelatase